MDSIEKFLTDQPAVQSGWIRCLIVNHVDHNITVVDAEQANLSQDAHNVIAALNITPNLEEDGRLQLLAHTIARFIDSDEGNAAQICVLAYALHNLDPRIQTQMKGAHPQLMCVVSNGSRIEVAGGDEMQKFAETIRLMVERMDTPVLH